MLRAARAGGLLSPLSQRWHQGFHKTAGACGLEDFFDSPRKEEERATAGRSWKASELRLKSWDDLHKLWYVLLKERNMLHSEALAAFAQQKSLQNPFRVRKVKNSMARLKHVLWERALVERNPQARLQMQHFVIAL
ncbi:hypothetical protein WJX74_010648 [Apatococcus lobatus]|uniref:Large ribosomal subunit protein uL29m n=1 Tax=Apatococcus lobatus TaxID=904363 RepID=A0AAW1QCW9_9CHLO